MALLILSLMLGIGQAPQSHPAAAKQKEKLDKSSYFAFVDRDFIFTLEMTRPGIAIFNFVSMIDEQRVLPAKQVSLALENRKAAAELYVIDTGDPKEPLIVPTLRIRPRSAFGVRLRGDFGEAKEIYGVSVTLGPEEFRLVPLSSFDFENLVLKVNRLNLGSPDFRDDWRVLKLETMGTRVPVRRR